MVAVNRKDLFGVVRRVVPAHGVKVGCKTESVAAGLLRDEANKLADVLQLRYPDEEYAVVETVFHRWTKWQT